VKDHDLAHARPWLLASLFFGISYVFVEQTAMLGGLSILWKGAGVALLLPYALRWRAVRMRALLGLMLGFYAGGDVVLEFDLVNGAFLFVCGHIAAIIYFWLNRRTASTPSQLLLAIVIPLAALTIGWFLAPTLGDEAGLLVYVGFVSLMAGTAWYSRFPRYRTGVGALLFLASDLFLLAREGGLLADAIAAWLVWPLYYVGVFMMTTGIVQRSRATAIDGEREAAL
tara:strand:- start:2875 stop:3555 length:681 start_codon:yes stop_codon:yes gene_type:complete